MHTFHMQLLSVCCCRIQLVIVVTVRFHNDRDLHQRGVSLPACESVWACVCVFILCVNLYFKTRAVNKYFFWKHIHKTLRYNKTHITNSNVKNLFHASTKVSSTCSRLHRKRPMNLNLWVFLCFVIILFALLKIICQKQQMAKHTLVDMGTVCISWPEPVWEVKVYIYIVTVRPPCGNKGECTFLWVKQCWVGKAVVILCCTVLTHSVLSLSLCALYFRTTKIWSMSLWWLKVWHVSSRWEQKPTRTTRTTFWEVRSLSIAVIQIQTGAISRVMSIYSTYEHSRHMTHFSLMTFLVFIGTYSKHVLSVCWHRCSVQ